MQLADESAQVLQSYAKWNTAALNISYILWAVGVLIALGYFLKLAATSDSKARYDYINRYEINVLWVASIVLVLGACFYANATVTELNLRWIVVRVFMTVAFGLIVAMIIHNLLKFYYPFYIEKRR